MYEMATRLVEGSTRRAVRVPWETVLQWLGKEKRAITEIEGARIRRKVYGESGQEWVRNGEVVADGAGVWVLGQALREKKGRDERVVRINVCEYQDFEGAKLVGWFDANGADKYDEATNWDGSNHISVPTGSQWAHQALYRTKGGRWVLHRWSNYGDSLDTYEFIDDEVAKEWLALNNHDDAIEAHFGEPLEEERGPGRPRIQGEEVKIKLTDEILGALDKRAEDEGKSRAAAVRELLAAALQL